ncbi:hypothetical protein GCM10020331_033800 [Ectobacillus funiculus]
MQLQAFLITFREVLEALLIVGIITTYLKRTDNKKFVKYVWMGGQVLRLQRAISSLFFFSSCIHWLCGHGQRDLFEDRDYVCFSHFCSHKWCFWMAEHSKDIKSSVEGKKMGQFITAGNVIGMVMHSFLVVVREGVETVFFSLRRLRAATLVRRCKDGEQSPVQLQLHW